MCSIIEDQCPKCHEQGATRIADGKYHCLSCGHKYRAGSDAGKVAK